MTESVSAAHRRVHVGRVNAVIDHIETHLEDDLTVEALADVAGFSAFHFHRIFSAVTGETLGRFVSRLRIERAASALVAHPSRKVTEIAAASGFSSPSTFSRTFRATYGMSPTQWREGGYARHGKRADVRAPQAHDGAAGLVGVGIRGVRIDDTGHTVWEVGAGALGPTSVWIEHVEPVEVAYVRYTGRYAGLGRVFTDLFTRLLSWAEPRGLLTAGTPLYAVYHDDPTLTEDDRLRVSVCLPVPPGTRADGTVGRLSLPGGRCAVATFELSEADYSAAWYALDAGWLPGSGYEPDDRLPFERFVIGRESGDPATQVVDIAIPVRPARAR